MRVFCRGLVLGVTPLPMNQRQRLDWPVVSQRLDLPGVGGHAVTLEPETAAGLPEKGKEGEGQGFECRSDRWRRCPGSRAHRRP